MSRDWSSEGRAVIFPHPVLSIVCTKGYIQRSPADNGALAGFFVVQPSGAPQGRHSVVPCNTYMLIYADSGSRRDQSHLWDSDPTDGRGPVSLNLVRIITAKDDHNALGHNG